MHQKSNNLQQHGRSQLPLPTHGVKPTGLQTGQRLSPHPRNASELNGRLSTTKGGEVLPKRFGDSLLSLRLKGIDHIFSIVVVFLFFWGEGMCIFFLLLEDSFRESQRICAI